MPNQANDKNRRQHDQQDQRRIDEQQQRQDRGARKPDQDHGQGKRGQGGQSDTNRAYSDRHPTSGPHTDED